MQFTIIPDEIPNNIEVSRFSAVWRQIRNTVVTGTGFAMDLLEQKAMESTNSSTNPSFNEKDGFQAVDLDAKSTNTVRTWREIFTSYSDQHRGFVESVEKATELLKKYELETTTKFCCYKPDKIFGVGGGTRGVGGLPNERGVDAHRPA